MSNCISLRHLYCHLFCPYGFTSAFPFYLSVPFFFSQFSPARFFPQSIFGHFVHTFLYPSLYSVILLLRSFTFLSSVSILHHFAPTFLSSVSILHHFAPTFLSSVSIFHHFAPTFLSSVSTFGHFVRFMISFSRRHSVTFLRTSSSESSASTEISFPHFL